MSESEQFNLVYHLTVSSRHLRKKNLFSELPSVTNAPWKLREPWLSGVSPAPSPSPLLRFTQFFPPDPPVCRRDTRCTHLTCVTPSSLVASFDGQDSLQCDHNSPFLTLSLGLFLSLARSLFLSSFLALCLCSLFSFSLRLSPSLPFQERDRSGVSCAALPPPPSPT